jgi:hypothetical protein
MRLDGQKLEKRVKKITLMKRRMLMDVGTFDSLHLVLAYVVVFFSKPSNHILNVFVTKENHLL